MGFPDLLLNFALQPVNEFNHVYVDARVVSTTIAATERDNSNLKVDLCGVLFY